MQIGKLSRKEKLVFIEVIKINHIYMDRVRIQFIITHKMNKGKEREKRKNIKSQITLKPATIAIAKTVTCPPQSHYFIEKLDFQPKSN